MGWPFAGFTQPRRFCFEMRVLSNSFCRENDNLNRDASIVKPLMVSIYDHVAIVHMDPFY